MTAIIQPTQPILYDQYHELPEGFNSLDLSDEQSAAWWYLIDPEFSEITRVIYGGQAYGGKSTLICLWEDYMCRTFEGTRYYLGRETLKDIKSSILLSFFDVVKLTGSKVHYSEAKSLLKYPNGSEIHLLETFNYPSDPNFDRFGSTEFTAGAIEEGVTTVKRAADILISRTRYKHVEFNLHPKQLITLNPGDGWIKDDIVIPQMETGKPKRSSDIFVPATLDSNPNKEGAVKYRKTLEENLSSYDRERLLNGNWNAKPKSGAEALKDFNHDIHVRKVAYDPELPLHIAFDENVNPHITCGAWQIFTGKDEVRECRLVKELCPKPPFNTRKRVSAMVKKEFPDHKAGMFIYGDASSQKNETGKEWGENFFTDIKTELRIYNPSMRVPSKNPGVVNKLGFMNLILEKEYRKIRIVIDPSCKIHIDDFAYAMEDAEGGISKKKVTDPETKIQYEKHGHAIDESSYFICFAFAGDFAAYKSGGVTPAYEVGRDSGKFAVKEF